jgi:type I restriction-modification system DNA methylase subunit
MPSINERQFQGRVLQWIAGLLKEYHGLPFNKVDQEIEVQINNQKRKFNDITIFDERNKPICIFEIKLPDRPDGQGRSPRHSDVVHTTQQKADRIGAEYFLTWNINSAVLWKTFIPGRSIQERAIRAYPSITSITESIHLDRIQVQEDIQSFLKDFLLDLAKIITGEVAITPQPLDEGFIQTVQSYLDPVITLLVNELLKRYRKDKPFAKGLHDWAVEDQGWTWEGSSYSLPDELERTARLACNMLLNKIVFYEAMRKVYPSLPILAVPQTIQTAKQLHKRLQELFSKARKIDYETVFTEEFIDQIPFACDEVVGWWRDLIHDVEEYDFTKLPYDVIGMIFQRLIAPDERHKLGQYFTPANVVDLINTFCIRKSDAYVLDPGCGAGTFLVRAYKHLKYLDPAKPHEELLEQLWGIDIAHYPAHLTTINLSVRDLSVTESYPKVIPDDFFKVFPEESKYPFPKKAHNVAGLSTQRVLVTVPKFDVVVGNPPYTRQEEMEDLYPGLKDRAHSAIHRDWTLEISKRASIYALFFLHGAAFVKEGGYLGLLTHNSWLDVDYGKHLQEFFLTHFKIIAILESQVEHWFPAVDVNTSIAILQRCSDTAERDKNLVKFVSVKVPLVKIIPQTADENIRTAALKQLVQRIESITELEDNEDWRVYPVKQADLWQEGLDEEGKFVGSKWGKYLRGPDIFFKIMKRAKAQMSHVSDFAVVQRGFTSGANDFFYVRDVTDEISDRELKDWFGLSKKETQKLRVIEAGDGERYLIEAEYLKPIVKSTRDIQSLLIDESVIKFHALMVNESKRNLKGKHVLKYILAGETKVFGSGPRAGVPAKKPTCASRNPWYALDPNNKGRFLWFSLITDTHAVAYNPKEFVADARFYNITPKQVEHEEVLFGLLNSLFTALCAELWGRQFAGRGIDSIDIKVYEVAQLPILNPEKIEPAVATEIVNAVKQIAGRSILPILQEVHQPDRQALDSAVLKAMGFIDPKERQEVLTELYNALCRCVQTRFERARSTQHQGQKRVIASPEAIAEELFKEFDTSLLKKFPDDFLPSRYAYKEVPLPDGTFDHERLTDKRLRLGKSLLEFDKIIEADFAQFALEAGATKALRLPTDTDLLRQAVKTYRLYLREMEEILEDLAASRTRDRKMKERIKDLLRQRLKLGKLEEGQMKLI